MQNKLNQPTTQTQNKGAINTQALTKYLAYWPIFALCLAGAIVAAHFYLKYSIPQYQADASVIIKDEKKGDANSEMLEKLNMIDAKKIIENEIEVLQSRSLMNEVVKRLHLYAPISQVGKIKSISAYQLSPLVVEAFDTDSIRESKETEKIDLKFDAAKGTVLLNGSFSGKINEWLHTPYGILRFIPNKRYLPGVNDKPFHFSLYNTKNVTASILASLRVSASNKLSSVIDLTFRDELPVRAEDILNELIKNYQNAAITEKNDLAKNTLVFIELRLGAVKKDLDSIESRLQQYKSGRGAVDITKQGQIYLESVATNDKKMSDLSIQSGVLDQLEKYASSASGAGILPSTLGISDPSLTQQLTNLNTLQMKYDQLKGTVAENNPVLQSITSQINEVRPTILNNIQSQRRSLEQSKNSLASTSNVYSSMLSSIPQKERQLVEISRDKDIKNGIYSFLLQKREETELSYASNISDSRVINWAQSSKDPVSPKKIMIYLAAIIAALGFPIAFITARDVMSSKVLYRQEVENLTSIPIIGEISYSKTKDLLVVQPGKRTVIAEEFRKIRVSLLSLGINATHKKVLVTSSISGEGKSFISANLATSLSLTGKRVVLVDMDLHNPGLGKFFGIKEQPGISEFLIGRKDLKDIIYNIPGNDNLFYISSGSLQQDSSELLENGKIASLISKLDTDFDAVIIDAAPIVLITDAYLLSSLCDATLYVVMHKKTPKVLIRRIDENLVVNPIKNPAIIFNGVRARGFFKNSNYGYGYSYGYSYDQKKTKKPLTKKFFSGNSV